MEVLINNLQKEYPIQDFCNLIIRGFEIVSRLENLCQELEVSVSFVDNVRIQALNREYRGVNRPTDVLSFPQDEDFNWPREAPCLLGDIVISLPRASEQARDFGHKLEREVVYLAIHGVLHLLGYDHKTPQETNLMRQKEEAILTELNLGRD